MCQRFTSLQKKQIYKKLMQSQKNCPIYIFFLPWLQNASKYFTAKTTDVHTDRFRQRSLVWLLKSAALRKTANTKLLKLAP